MFNWHSLTTICQSVTEIGYLQLKKLLQHTILTVSLNDTIHIKRAQLYGSNFQSRTLVKQVLLWCNQIRNNLSTHFIAYSTQSLFFFYWLILWTYQVLSRTDPMTPEYQPILSVQTSCNKCYHSCHACSTRNLSN